MEKMTMQGMYGISNSIDFLENAYSGKNIAYPTYPFISYENYLLMRTFRLKNNKCSQSRRILLPYAFSKKCILMENTATLATFYKYQLIRTFGGILDDGFL